MADVSCSNPRSRPALGVEFDPGTEAVELIVLQFSNVGVQDEAV